MENQLQLVTFEQAKRLKAAGFDWETKDTYLIAGDGMTYNVVISKPTIAHALMWFREVHGCHLFIYPDNFTNAIDEWFILFIPVMNILKDGKVISSNVLIGNSDYNEAKSSAFDAALDWLEKEKVTI
jgi:hypothetical protein